MSEGKANGVEVLEDVFEAVAPRRAVDEYLATLDDTRSYAPLQMTARQLAKVVLDEFLAWFDGDAALMEGYVPPEQEFDPSEGGHHD